MSDIADPVALVVPVAVLPGAVIGAPEGVAPMPGAVFPRSPDWAEPAVDPEPVAPEPVAPEPVAPEPVAAEPPVDPLLAPELAAPVPAAPALPLLPLDWAYAYPTIANTTAVATEVTSLFDMRFS